MAGEEAGRTWVIGWDTHPPISIPEKTYLEGKYQRFLPSIIAFSCLETRGSPPGMG